MLFNAIDKSIYENFKPIPFHCVGWGAESEIFATLIKEIRPISILEIGSWHGKSAITMAKCAKSLGLQFTITCVDTWLGALEFWENPDGDRDLRMVNGFPQVYYQFLSNVVHSGFKENILPFPITSNIAYRFFQNKNTKFDLIYIDASHNYDDVYSDMRFLNLLSPSVLYLVMTIFGKVLPQPYMTTVKTKTLC